MKLVNDFAIVIYDNPCYFDKSYDNPLFIPTIDMHDNEEVCVENLYDNALDDGPMLLDAINYNATGNYYERGNTVVGIFMLLKHLSFC